MSEPLTDEQVENFRRALAIQYGPVVARIATREDIQAYRDRLQDLIDTAYGDGPEAERARRVAE